jgi:LacI family transcriptional regulator
MASRANIRDVARVAQVSTATVDRVLHGRGGYSKASADRVIEAIEQLGYGRLAPHVREGRKKSVRVTMILPNLLSEFVEGMVLASKELRTAYNSVRVDLNAVHGPFETQSKYASLIDEVDARSTDCLCVFASDSAAVRQAIDRAASRGIRVFTIVSDSVGAHRVAHVGIDNAAAGRSAGRLIAKLNARRSGTVAVLTGSNTIRRHLERYMGMTQSITRLSPNLTLLPVIESGGDDPKNKAIALKLLEDNPDLVAIYNIGGGNDGLVQALRSSGREQDIVTIVHQLSDSMREAVSDGSVDFILHQDPHGIMQKVFDLMIRREAIPSQSTFLLPTQIYIADNLP